MNNRFWSLMAVVQMVVALPASAELVKQVERGKVAGTVAFEYRTGVAPTTMQPMPYWTVVIHDAAGVAYELAHITGLNREAPPSSTTINGTVVRQGEEVAVEGKIQKLKKDFGLVSDVRKIRVLRQERSGMND